MHRHLRSVVVALAVALAVGVATASAAPAEHFEESVVGDVFVCASATYTVTSKARSRASFHEGQQQRPGTPTSPERSSPSTLFSRTSDGERLLARGRGVVRRHRPTLSRARPRAPLRRT